MKIRHILVVLLVLTICTAQRCNQSSSDLLTRMYNRAYKSYTPLTAKKEPVYKPLLGCWIIGNERAMVVSKVDELNLEFAFLSNSLRGENIVYNGYTTTIGGKPYLNMLAYKGYYIFFRIEQEKNKAIHLNLISDLHNGAYDKGLFEYLKSHPTLSDTNAIWYPVTIERITENQLKQYMMHNHRHGVSGIEDFDLYETKYPDDPSLDSLRIQAITHSIRYANEPARLKAIGERFPAYANAARKEAKSHCNNTKWCCQYIAVFSDDPAKDSIKDIAFKQAQTANDFESLIALFPEDKRTKEFDFKIALSEMKRLDADNISSYEVESIMKKYESRPEVLNHLSLLKLIGNITLDATCFYTNSYLLTAKGKTKIDQLSPLLQRLNQQRKNLTDIYLSIVCKETYSSGPGELINLKLSANRCISVKKYFDEKYPGAITIHCVPQGEKFGQQYENTFGRFYVVSSSLSDQRNQFFSKCYSLRQSVVIADGNKELMNTDYVREEELEDYILSNLEIQMMALKKNEPTQRIIPPNFMDDQYKKIQPDFASVKEKILMKAAEKGFDVKKLQAFIVYE